MATTFPGALDEFTNPSANDKTNVVSHAAQHANANDAIEALEAKVGADGSAVETSHDFRLSALAAAVTNKADTDDPRFTDARAPTAHDHDTRYYTEAEVDALLSGLGGGPAFPVGSIFIAAVNTNPATLLGYGTWAAFGAGRVLVGFDAAQTEFDAAEKTGGAKTHTLQVTEIPAHTHVQNAHTHDFLPRSGTTGSVSSIVTGTLDTSSAIGGANQPHVQPATAVNQNAGGGAAHNNLAPFVTVFFWKRTA
jgi:hypothetical protein